MSAGIRASEEQAQAADAPLDGRRLIDAGAGTGKTTTIELRVRRLLESRAVAPEELLIVTFTRKAAAEIRERLARGSDANITCATIHSLAAEQLRELSHELGTGEPPRPAGDAEARALFDAILDDAFAGRLALDARAFPLHEIGPENARRELAALALRLNGLGIDAETFERRALAAADALSAQSWGQIWTQGKTKAKPRIDCDPKAERTQAERRLEAERERANVRFVAALLRAFETRLLQAGIATYGDLLSRVTRAFEARPELARRLRARIRYVLVDEFQDTSAQQLAFLRALFGNPDCDRRMFDRIMVVGDFRQSIYGFNGADPEVMARFRSEADAVHTLSLNRRSLANIVEIAHRVLSEGDHPVDPEGEPMRAVRGDGGDPCVFVARFGTPEQSSAERLDAEADAIAREIARLRASGRAYEEIAVLLRKRTHARRFAEALERRGIPAALDRRAGLLDAPEIRDARAWLSLACMPQDALAIVRVLRSPQIGCSDADLARMAAQVERNDWAAVAFDGTADERLERLRALLAELLDMRTLLAAHAVERLLSIVPIAASHALTRGAAPIANLHAFAALARRFAGETTDARLDAFLRYLDLCEEYDERIAEPQLAASGVAITTVHQAKGLEWEIVFVAQATEHQYGSMKRSAAIDYDARDGALILTRDIDGRRTLRGLLHKESYDPVTGERTPDARKIAVTQEERRVFYVALTRARDRLYVSAPDTGKAPYAGYAIVERYGAPWPCATAEEQLAIPEANDAPTLDLNVVGASPRERAPLPSDMSDPTISFSALSTFDLCPRQARYRYRLRFPDLRPPKILHDAEFGSLVHHALELWGRTAMSGLLPDADEILDRAFRSFPHLARSERTRALAFVRHGIALLADLRPTAVEHPFTHEIAGMRLSGTIDLVALDAEGTTHVVDYKTGTHGREEQQALQLDLYARAVAARAGNGNVRARLLRLHDNGAEWHEPPMPPATRLEELVATAGKLESDEPRTGAHCRHCPYYESPCDAKPL